MKIAFLRPNLGGQHSNDAIEPLGFAVLSGLTDRNKHEVLLFDERIEDIPMDLEVDLVVITTFTLTAKRTYTIADNYKKRYLCCYRWLSCFTSSRRSERICRYCFCWKCRRKLGKIFN